MTAHSPRRIVIFLHDLHWRGGTQRTATDLALLLAENHDVTILTCAPLDRTPAFFDPRITYESLGITRGSMSRLATLAFLARTAIALRKFRKAKMPDVVVSLWFDMSIAAAFGLLGTRTRAIAWEHIEYSHPGRGWLRLRNLAYPALSAVVCLTDADLPRYQRLNRESVVIRNFVPDRGFVPQLQKQRKLLCVGHIIPRKGFDRLLWQLADVFRQFPDWRLTIVGGGDLGIVDPDYFVYLTSLIAGLELSGRVEFVPANDQIETYFADSSIYTMASLSEGLPMVLLEAKMAAMPVVAFDCPTGPREIIRDEIDGYLIPPGSGKFGPALCRLMGDAELRQRTGDAGRNDALARFTASQIAQQWRDLIDRVTGPTP